MTSQATLQPPETHEWLRRVLSQLGEGGTPPELPPDLEEAWVAACEHCGLAQDALAREIARQWGLRHEPLPQAVPPECLKLMQSRVLQAYRAVPLRRGLDHVVLAVANPAAPDLLDRACFDLGVPVDLVVAPPAPLRRLYEAAGIVLPKTGAGAIAASSDAVQPEEGEPHEAHEAHAAQAPGMPGEFRLEDAPDASAVVRLCNLMLRHAMTHGASDIHVQPVGRGALVRMRFDGLLRVVGRLPTAAMLRLIGRVKAVAGMNPTDRMHPQDSHARATWGGRSVDLRVSTLPVTGGEKLVIRLLGGNEVMQLQDLDLAPAEMQQVRNLIDATMGVVIVAGPTGSGKTTTLYAILDEKNTVEVNIVTVEDPVEIHLPRLAQTGVNPRSGLDFANALRSVVRQDPDIILIGEIRDGETASIAMQAAITGHLVFASLHANDAVSVLPRLAELGVGADLTAEAVRGIVSQRLVRTVCQQCAQPAAPPFTPAEAWLMAHAGLEQPPPRAPGCPSCGGTGYRGRRSIVQVVTTTPELARLLDHGAPLSQVRDLARRQGARFLSESALDRVRRGQTTVEEVLRVLGTDFWREITEATGASPPADLRTGGAGHADDTNARGSILLVAKDPAWHATLRDWLLHQGWPVISANNEQGVLEAMTHHADFAVGVIDLALVDPQRSRALLDIRGLLAGAAVPLLVFDDAGNSELAQHMARHANVLLAKRPRDAGALQSLLESALG